ncbi:MAG: enoyl-CoA hydratase/isomerase family protein [Actinomycetota bacterium]|nr:enoyl-CoA hydratase/isomerase family protein [Acidimicrobiales bacterium]
MNQLVTRTDRDGISTLELNRPQALNALSPSMFVELRDHLEDLSLMKDEIGVIILSAAGKSFSAGNDLKAIQRGDRSPSPHYQAETLDLIESMPQPVIAAVQGYCYTGALELVLACDLLICADDAIFCDSHGKWSMVPTWGMTTRLPERVGLMTAKDIMYSGRSVSGKEAVQVGLANRSVPEISLKASAFEWAASISANSWHTLAEEKKQILALSEMERSEGLKWARENGPGAGADMKERIQNSFGR